MGESSGHVVLVEMECDSGPWLRATLDGGSATKSAFLLENCVVVKDR